jgi:hypothetical protein
MGTRNRTSHWSTAPFSSRTLKERASRPLNLLRMSLISMGGNVYDSYESKVKVPIDLHILQFHVLSQG